MKYFDPIKVKIDDSILGMKVTGVSAGTGDPGSYSIFFEEIVKVSGSYSFEQDDQRGPYLSLETTMINGQKYKIQLSLFGNQDELNKAFKGNKNGLAQLKIKNITIQNIPHKPAFNSAFFVSITKLGM